MKISKINCSQVSLLLFITFLLFVTACKKPESSDNGSESKSKKPDVTITPPKDSKAIDRICDRKIKAEFSFYGRGEDAKWGISKSANFKYTAVVLADSKIESKEELPGGEIKVTEIRTYGTVMDSLMISDIDMNVRLDTLPVKEFSATVDTLISAWEIISKSPAAPFVRGGKALLDAKLKDIDGKGVRDFFGHFGIRPHEKAEELINTLANAEVKKALSCIRDISKQSYRVVYYQKKNGEPLYVNFTYTDGSEVNNPDERMVLRRINSFIDSHIVPDRNCKPGDSWTVQASDMQEAFDPYVDGKYTGKISVRRESDNSDGNWKLAINPSVINIRDDRGNSSGVLNLREGYAHVSPQIVCVNDLKISGDGRISKLSKHHFLFNARISGNCDFEGRIVTIHDTPFK